MMNEDIHRCIVGDDRLLKVVYPFCSQHVKGTLWFIYINDLLLMTKVTKIKVFETLLSIKRTTMRYKGLKIRLPSNKAYILMVNIVPHT